MGFDVTRFCGDVDDELLCPICTGVLDDPVQAQLCEHAFCKPCINEWLHHQSICPVDRQVVTTLQLVQVPRILKNMLAKLSIQCENQANGCAAVVKLESLSNHLSECLYNPKRKVQCEQGCGHMIPLDEIKDHNCIRELRAVTNKQKQKISELELELQGHSYQIANLRREIQVLKEYMKILKMANPSVRAITDEIERNEIIQWSNTLTRARVTRWGGMISTPDEYLQNSIRTALQESGCPSHILDDLMENCHERNWPCGLSSLETRQNNRRYYENYVCKRIPGKQAVVVLQVDNTFVKEDMMVDPGLVMIFAHGIE